MFYYSLGTKKTENGVGLRDKEAYLQGTVGVRHRDTTYCELGHTNACDRATCSTSLYIK